MCNIRLPAHLFLLWNQISAAPLLGETIFKLWDGGVIREVKEEGKLLNLLRGVPFHASWSECFVFRLEKWTYMALNVKSQRLRPRGWCTPTISHQDQTNGCVHPSTEDKQTLTASSQLTQNNNAVPVRAPTLFLFVCVICLHVRRTSVQYTTQNWVGWIKQLICRVQSFPIEIQPRQRIRSSRGFARIRQPKKTRSLLVLNKQQEEQRKDMLLLI